MTVAVYTTGKVSMARGVSATAAVIDGLPGGRVTVARAHRPPHVTPNSAAQHALAYGVRAALDRGADDVDVYSPSKNAVKAVDGTGGASYATAQDAYAAAWVIKWRAGATLRFHHRPNADMPEVVDAAARALDADAPAEQGTLL